MNPKVTEGRRSHFPLCRCSSQTWRARGRCSYRFSIVGDGRELSRCGPAQGAQLPSAAVVEVRSRPWMPGSTKSATALSASRCSSRDRAARGLHLQPVPRRSATSRCSSTAACARCSRWCRGGRQGHPVERLRWLGFGHFEADECGSMNEWLAAAPHAAGRARHDRLHGLHRRHGDPRARMLADGEVVDLGGKRVRYIDTPHVPHGWDAGVLFEETSRTLLCGDCSPRPGRTALTESDIVGALDRDRGLLPVHLPQAVDRTGHPQAGRSCPRKLAVMHGSSFRGRCRHGTAESGQRIRQQAAAGAGRAV